MPVATLAAIFLHLFPLHPATASAVIQKPPIVRAQMAGFAGGGRAVVLYYQKVSNAMPPVTPPSCPSGSNAVTLGPGNNTEGYGPHYAGLLAYDWLQGGSGGTPGGFGIPGNPPPTPPTLNPPRGPVTGAPPAIADPVPVDPPPDGPEIRIEPLTPPAPEPGSPPDSPPEPSDQPGPSAPGSFLWPRFIETAYAQIIPAYVLKDVAVASDSVCSDTSKEVVPLGSMYLNFFQLGGARIYSDACFTDTSVTPNVTTCNRCKICYR